ncbi:MAG: type II secretion system F family protein [Hyphomonadaceae bacterium]
MFLDGTILSIVIALVLGLFAVALTLIYLADESVRRRLSAVGGGRRGADEHVPSDGLAWLVRIGRRLQGADQGKAEALGALRIQLIQAGIYAEHAAPAFAAVRVLLAFSLGFAAGFTLLIFRMDNAVLGALVVVICAGAGMFAPLILIKARAKERIHEVRCALPDAIDLLVVAMEAGSSLVQALQRVSNELKTAHPVISAELQMTLLEMQAGASRAEALRHLSERVPDDRLRSFLTLVIQSDQLGAGLANTLRVFAEELRRSRLIEAEHKAAELPVKIAIPLVFFIFPCLMGIIFTPILIRFIRILFQVGA